MRRNGFVIVIVSLLAALGVFPALADEDARTAVTLKPEIREQFLAEMRRHMETLDDLVAAIGSADFGEAAAIADIRLDFGHHPWEAMAAEGATTKKRTRSMGMGPGPGMGAGMGRGMGMGRYMPPEFRAMGQSMHAAGGDLVRVLRGAATPPTAEDYRAAIEALANVTTVCRACHATFKVR